MSLTWKDVRCNWFGYDDSFSVVIFWLPFHWESHVKWILGCDFIDINRARFLCSSNEFPYVHYPENPEVGLKLGIMVILVCLFDSDVCFSTDVFCCEVFCQSFICSLVWPQLSRLLSLVMLMAYPYDSFIVLLNDLFLGLHQSWMLPPSLSKFDSFQWNWPKNLIPLSPLLVISESSSSVMQA